MKLGCVQLRDFEFLMQEILIQIVFRTENHGRPQLYIICFICKNYSIFTQYYNAKKLKLSIREFSYMFQIYFKIEIYTSVTIE